MPIFASEKLSSINLFKLHATLFVWYYEFCANVDFRVRKAAIKLFKMCATFFVWYCGFLACTWQCRYLRDLVKQGDPELSLNVAFLDKSFEKIIIKHWFEIVSGNTKKGI